MAYRPGKGGHALFADNAGNQLSVPCGRAGALCDHLKAHPDHVLELRLVRVGLLDDVWLLSAVIDGQDLLQRADIDLAYDHSTATHLALASAFLLAALAFWRFAYASQRALAEKKP